MIVRVDFNVPINEEGEIADTSKIAASLPTLRYLLEQNAIIILLSHLGRPKGEKDSRYSLHSCATALSGLLKYPVLFANDCLDPKIGQQISTLCPKEILLLENLRFYPAEEHPTLDSSFAKKLASYGEIYINDAFASSHRKHASIYEVPSYFPGKAAAGFLLQKEIQVLSKLSSHPDTPFHVIIGGAKISSKIGVLQSLIPKMQSLYIGGGMAFTFFAALGHSIGDSLYEPDHIQTAHQILQSCKKANMPIFLPLDLVIYDGKTSCLINSTEKIEKGWKGMDIGPKTLSFWEQELKKARSIFWNGPVGVFENHLFAQGTHRLAEFLSSLSSDRVVGGGDSIAAIHQLHLTDKFTHISTGGGASLEFLEKGSLPGIDALR